MSGGQHWQGAAGRTPYKPSAPGSNKYLDHHSFDDSTGEVYCFCNTAPRIKAIRRVTRKESSPNLGREFWTCGNWVEGDGCGFFLWCDQAASQGRRYRTPPPPGAAAIPSAGPSSPQKRPRPSTPPPRAASAKPASSFRPPATPSADDTYDDIDFDALSANLEDEIEDSYEEEPPTQYSSAPEPTPSPSKKARFTSFGGGGGGGGGGSSGGSAREDPTTPTKARPGETGSKSGFAAIRDDPSSPFHALQRDLFGPGSSPGPAPASSLPSSPTKPGASGDADDAFSALSAALASLPGLVDGARKDKERDGRLLAAAKKKEEALRRQVEKGRDEAERVRKENEALKERVRMLEEEVNELRTRVR
ncbi:hypothetical protein JCM10207_007709 [Rhodosporidiobolus poonsookiae]